MTKNVYGAGADQFWIYEPASPTPKSAPLIIFLHGGLAINPKTHGAWMKHLVRKGNIVVWPRYQNRSLDLTEQVLWSSIDATKKAIDILQSGGHVSPQLDKFAIVGISLGGAITVDMAALAESEGLPQPKAVMAVVPGNRPLAATGNQSRIILPMEDLSKIPSSVLMLTVVEIEDDRAGDVLAKQIFYDTPQIPLANKDFITVMSDYHGESPLIADHFSSLGTDVDFDNGIEVPGTYEINALDYAHWKLFDGLTDAAFYGRNREYALGDSPKQRFVGFWSDGTPVNELKVTDNP
jgi:dienelactone hydrolase